MRRLSALVATAATVLVVIGMASPARAADSGMDCSTPSSITPNPQPIAVATTVGATYTIQNTNSTSCLIAPGGGATSHVSWTSFTGQSGSGRVWTYTFTITSGGGGGGGSSSSSSASSAPAPIFQQFGKPASGTCAEAASDSLNWSGVASGGWSESWAQWMNGGTGGAVCTRTLVYSTSQGAWTLG